MAPCLVGKKETRMSKDRKAQRAIEGVQKGHVVRKNGPPAGPHAQDHLIDAAKTPGTGMLADTDEENVSPAGG